MTLYQGNDFTLTLPNGLQDNTIHVFAVSQDSPGDFGLVIHRDTLVPGETVEDYVIRQKAAIAGKLADLCVVRELRTEIAGLPAVELEFTWRHEGRPVQQRQACVACGTRVWIVTGTFQESTGSEWLRAYDGALRTLRLQPSREP